MDKVNYMHFDCCGVRSTVAYIIHDYYIEIGYTKLHKNDQYVKSIGRELATKRLNEKSDYYRIIDIDGMFTYSNFNEYKSGVGLSFNMMHQFYVRNIIHDYMCHILDISISAMVNSIVYFEEYMECKYKNKPIELCIESKDVTTYLKKWLEDHGYTQNKPKCVPSLGYELWIK